MKGRTSLRKVSYCTPCKGRLQHLMETLPRNMAAERNNPNVEFVVLDYDCPQGTADWVKANFASEIRSGRLRCARHEPVPHFKMAHAKNMAHRVATGDILCNVDADNFIVPDFSTWVTRRFAVNPRCFLFSRAVTLGRDLEHKILWRLCRIKLPTNGLAGRIVISRDCFEELGGYDEAFSAHGGDDLDFGLRARDLGLQPVRFPRKYWGAVIAHSDEMRVEALSPQDRDKTQSQLTIKSSKLVKLWEDLIDNGRDILRTRRPDVNNGWVGCGQVVINFDEAAQTIGPLPNAKHSARCPASYGQSVGSPLHGGISDAT